MIFLLWTRYHLQASMKRLLERTAHLMCVNTNLQQALARVWMGVFA
jgi:hypothetical protein